MNQIRIRSYFNFIPDFYWKGLYFVVAIIICLIEAEGRSDFDIYLMASKDLIQQINPYSHSYIDGYYYYYSILFAYLIYPFSFLGQYWRTFFWLLFNAYLLYKVIQQVGEFLDIPKLLSRESLVFYALLLLFNVRTIRENFHSAQVTILILFLMLYSLKYLVENKIWLSALLLGLAVNIKLLALPVVVYYFYRGKFKIVMYVVLFVVSMYFLPLLWMNSSFYYECMQQWWMNINPNNDKHLIDVEERSFHSITTLISTLFLAHPPDMYALPIRRYIIDLDIQEVKLLIQIVRVILISSVLMIVRSFPFQKLENKHFLFFEWSYVVALIPLVFPHQQHYAFLLQMPSISILLYLAIHNRLNKIEMIGLVILFLCFNLKVLLGMWNEYYDHYKILTYGGLITLVLMLLVGKKKDEIGSSAENKKIT